MWRDFVARTGGDAPDMPGFGSTAKSNDGDYSFRGLGRWFSDYTKDLERFSLVVHDWGAVGLLAAMERPETQVPDRVFEDALDSIWKYFDHGTQRAILRLYRSAPESLLAEVGRDLDKIKAPALVVWGAQDPYLPIKFAHDYAHAVGAPAEVEIVEGAGHWPWYEKPQVIERVATFLQS